MSPMVIVPDGYCEVGIEFQRGGGLVAVITFGVKLKAAPTQSTVRDDIKNAWNAAGSMTGAHPPTMPAKNMHLKWVYGGVAGSATTTANLTAGGGSPALASPSVALVAQKKTGFSGRKMRGRFMIPWCSESDVDAVGNVAAATITGYNSGLSAFRVALAAAARVKINGMYLLHSDATAPTLVTSLVLRSHVGTVRQRQKV